MEPFSVICETCSARLKVRSASVIGQIHACPRCESMVQIVAPVGFQQDAVEVPSAAAPASPAIAEPQFAPSIDEQPAPASEPLTATELPQSFTPPIRLLQRPMLLGAVGGVAAVLAIGLIAFIAMRGGGDPHEPTTIAVTNPSATYPHPEPAPDASDVGNDHDAQPDPLDDVIAPPTIEPPAEPLVTVPLPDLPADPDGADEDRGDPATEATAEPDLHVDETPAAPSEAPVVDNVRTPRLAFDPLDFDPARLRLSSGGDRVVASVEPDSDSAPTNSNAYVADPELAAPDGAAASDAPAHVGMHGVDNGPIAVRLGPTAGDLPARAAAKQLALPIGRLEVRAAPLAKFVALLADMADVPITLDPAALTMSGISAREPITIDAADTTLGELLRDELATYGLDHVERDGQVLVVRPDQTEVRSVNYDVKDLVAPGAPDAGDVAAMIERLVAPESWKSAGGNGTIEIDGTTLRIEHSYATHVEILLFCERLRMARGLVLRSRYPAARITIESPHAQLTNSLDTSATFTFLPWTRLAEVVRHWEDATGLTILVDWPALAEVDLAPSSPLACAIDGETWHEALAAVLEPLGLTWRAVDAESIQITTPAAASNLRCLGFYEIPTPLREQFADDAGLIGSLTNELINRGTDVSAPLHLELDAHSGRLIVLADDEAQRTIHQRMNDGSTRSLR